MTPIQKIELTSLAVAGFSSVVSPALATLNHPIASLIVGGLGAASIAIKGYFTKSPKEDPDQQITETTQITQSKSETPL